MHSRELGQVAVTVQDIDAAITFYRDVIGLHFLFQAGPTLAFFDMGGVRLMLSLPEESDSSGNSVLYFRTGSVDEEFQRIGSRAHWEGEPHLIANMPDHQLWMVFLRDPSGNLLAFMEERR